MEETLVPMMPDETLLVICHANLIRSAVAAVCLERHLTDLQHLHVASAGLHTEDGSSPPELVVRLAADAGADLSSHRSLSVTRDLVASADIVVTMTEGQRSEVARVHRADVARTFTLRELVRLLAGAEPVAESSWRAVAQRAHARRPLVAASGDREDVVDPNGQSDRVHRHVVHQLAELTERVSSFVAATPGSAH